MWRKGVKDRRRKGRKEEESWRKGEGGGVREDRNISIIKTQTSASLRNSAMKYTIVPPCKIQD